MWSAMNGMPGVMDKFGAFNPPFGYEVLKVSLKRGILDLLLHLFSVDCHRQ